MNAFECEVDDELLQEALSTFGTRAKMAMQMYCETAASSLESYMKQNRPWTDRTAQARQRLHCYVEKTDTGFCIVLAHGVDYGIWLELAKEKKYAILEPTVRLRGPEVVRKFHGLLDSLKGV